MTEVNVNLALNKYSSNFHIYQGICPKNKFFVSYHKMLCKHIYVNLSNRIHNTTFLSLHSPTFGGTQVFTALYLPYPFPAALHKPKLGKTAAKAVVFRKFVESHKALFPFPAAPPAAARQYPGQQTAPQHTHQ